LYNFTKRSQKKEEEKKEEKEGGKIYEEVIISPAPEDFAWIGGWH
jgi:hypothetical protein